MEITVLALAMLYSILCFEKDQFNASYLRKTSFYDFVIALLT